MNQQFRAIAIDFDGTLTISGEPSKDVLNAIQEARQKGLRVFLITGRILAELRDVFPSVDDYFDAVVVENGAAFSINGSVRLLSAPVEFELDEALVGRAVPFRRGQVLLASQVAYENSIQAEIRRLGLECQLVRNRGELMVLPPAVSKGLGLSRALQEFGISHHNTVAVGDAENDHSLLAGCEIGVAVENAVEGLKRHADLVLDLPNGEGVAALLRRSILGTQAPLRPRRWRLELGRFENGDRATISASQMNILITGRSKSGKSFLAGGITERLIELGYSACLIDPEGDYKSLGELHGVQCLGKPGQPPDMEQIRNLIKQHFGSVIVDMSTLDADKHADCTERLVAQLSSDRAMLGLPHWIIVDEAHHALGLPGGLLKVLKGGEKGFCLVTYRPQALAERLQDSIDVVLILAGGKRLRGPDPIREIERVFKLDLANQLDSDRNGQALFFRPGDSSEPRWLTLLPRRTAHVRHWHKYLHAKLPPRLRFVFRGSDNSSAAIAANVQDFHDLLRSSEADVLAGHAMRGDFSRWVIEALQDTVMGKEIETTEQSFVSSGRGRNDMDTLKNDVLAAIERRYVD